MGLSTYHDIKQGEKGAWVSICAYIILSLLKFTVGFIGNSEALRADGLNNSTDVIASVAILIGMKIARKPPDENHRYGHFRAETIASLIASFIMFSVGVQVLIGAGKALYLGTSETPQLLTAWTALFSGFVMFFVYRYNVKLAKKINSQSLRAAAQDNRADALVSLGAFVGIIGSILGIVWLDTLAAFVVGMIICKTAWEIFHETTHDLTDGFNEDNLQKIKKTIWSTPGVKSIVDIKARKHGNQPLVDVTIEVDPHLNVVESHEISEEVEVRMLKKHKISHVHVHIEPISKTDGDVKE